MEKRSKDAYICPAVEFIDVCSEGILCTSDAQEIENLVEFLGSWGN